MSTSEYIPNIGSKDRASDGSEAASHDCMDFRPTNKKILLIHDLVDSSTLSPETRLFFLLLAPAGGRSLHPTKLYPLLI